MAFLFTLMRNLKKRPEQETMKLGYDFCLTVNREVIKSESVLERHKAQEKIK